MVYQGLFTAERSTTQPIKQQRDQLTVFCFGLFFAGVFVAPISLPRMPQAMKTLSLLTGAIGAICGTYYLGENERRTKIDNSLEQMQLDALKQDVAANAAYHKIASEINSKQSIAEYIRLSIPPHQWMIFAQRYGVAEFFIAPPPVIEPGYSYQQSPVDVSGLMDQGNLQDEVIAAAADELSVDWFDGWGKRSGVICGESGDGKTFCLEQVVLADFVRAHGAQGKVYICDLDYGSSHDGAEPCLWLGLSVGKHIYIRAQDCYTVITRLSDLVDQRAEETAIAASRKQPKPYYAPALLIIDELPALMSQFSEAQQKEVVDAIANILRRGLKQGNVTFKIGTQTLAVGRTKIPREILQQTEIVMLWRSAQVPENYQNLGLKDKAAEQIVSGVDQFPRRVANRFVCVKYQDKKLEIAGIPAVERVNGDGQASAPEQEEISTPLQSGDYFAALSQWCADHPGWSDRDLASEFTRLTGRGINQEQLEMLKDCLNRPGEWS